MQIISADTCPHCHEIETIREDPDRFTCYKCGWMSYKDVEVAKGMPSVEQSILSGPHEALTHCVCGCGTPLTQNKNGTVKYAEGHRGYQKKKRFKESEVYKTAHPKKDRIKNGGDRRSAKFKAEQLAKTAPSTVYDKGENNGKHRTN